MAEAGNPAMSSSSHSAAWTGLARFIEAFVSSKAHYVMRLPGNFQSFCYLMQLQLVKRVVNKFGFSSRGLNVSWQRVCVCSCGEVSCLHHFAVVKFDDDAQRNQR